jgi:fructose-1,6-bisphosphatase/inositol monophosphatase family enzyme
MDAKRLITDEELLNVATQAILAGSRHIRMQFDKPLSELRPVFKNPEAGGSLQTIIDKNSERDILSVLLSSPFRDDTIIAEENGAIDGPGPRTWFVDGFDGTANIHIALRESSCGLVVRQADEVILAAGVDPFEELLYVGMQGRGAFVYDLRFSGEEFEIASDATQIRADPGNTRSANSLFMLVDASFKPRHAERKSAWLFEMSSSAFHARMIGSNIKQGLLLAHGRGHVAMTDRIGGFFDLAGYFVAREAGAFVGNLDGNVPVPGDPVVCCAANETLFELALAATRKCYGPDSKLGSGPFV